MIDSQTEKSFILSLCACTRSLMCKDGRFSIPNLHNYQHAASYPAFMLSGVSQTLLRLRAAMRIHCPSLS